MPTLSFLPLLLIVLTAHASAHIPADSTRDTCLVVTRNKTNQKVKTETFFTGNRVTVKLRRGGIVHGRIVRMTDRKLLIGTREVMFDEMRWLKRAQPNTSNLIGCGLMTGAGLAFLLSTQDYVLNHDPVTEGEQLGGTALFFTAGIILLTNRTKFHPAEGDQFRVERIQQTVVRIP